MPTHPQETPVHPHRRDTRRRVQLSAAACALTLVAGCSATTGTSTDEAGAGVAAGTVMDDAAIHDIDVTFDEEDYDAMIATYRSSGEKEWISATVTIDGETFEDVGLRLKGNSSLQGLRQAAVGDTGDEDGDSAADDAAAEGDADEADADDADADGDTGGIAGGPAGMGGGIEGDVSAEEPETLPWLIRLDKFVDGQELDGLTELVIRSNRSETSLNEAVALDLLELSGLASQQAVATRVSVNDSEEVLRLVVQNPDERWEESVFDTEGVLYKAEAGGDYSYRGDDPAAYEEVFDQETGEEDLTPLIDFLEFLDTSDDATFAAELDQHLDVDAFATYLALQDLIGNTDDIDGPGNNSYLRYDATTGRFTVVTWDLNLAFGGLGGGGMMRGLDGAPPTEGGEDGMVRPAPGDGEGMPDWGGEAPGDLPEGFTPMVPGADGELPDGVIPDGVLPDGVQRMGIGGGNILSERFLEVEAFADAYAQAQADLQATLYDSGAAQEVLDRWTALLEDQASGLVDSATLAEEAAAIEAYFDGEGTAGPGALPIPTSEPAPEPSAAAGT